MPVPEILNLIGVPQTLALGAAGKGVVASATVTSYLEVKVGKKTELRLNVSLPEAAPYRFEDGSRARVLYYPDCHGEEQLEFRWALAGPAKAGIVSIRLYLTVSDNLKGGSARRWRTVDLKEA